MTLFPTGDGRVHLAAPAHVTSSDPTKYPLTPALAAEIGQAHDLLSAHDTTLHGFQDEVQAVGAKIIRYGKLNAEGKAAALTLPTAARSHAVGGAERFDPTWGVYPMQPDNKDWQAHHLTELKDAQGWYDGHFGDSFFLSYQQGGHKPAKPTAYTTEYTEAEWDTLIAKNVASWEAAVGKPIMVNGLQASSLQLLSPRVCMIENAFGSQTGKLPTAAAWISTMQLLIAAQTARFQPWVYVKLFQDDPVLRDTWASLVIPSMLLADQGALLCTIGLAEGMRPVWETGEYKDPRYTPGIGKPTLSMQMTPSGIYCREFEEGDVAVNPTASPITYTPTDAASSPAPISIPAQSGVILKRTETIQWTQVAA